MKKDALSQLLPINVGLDRQEAKPQRDKSAKSANLSGRKHGISLDLRRALQ